MKKFFVILGIAVPVLIGAAIIVLLILRRDVPPPDLSDLKVDRPDVADENNAFTYFEAAAEKMYRPSDAEFIWAYVVGEPVDPQTVQEVLARNEETFESMRKGVACEICLPPRVVSPYDHPPHLQDWRALANLLAFKARHDRLAGDHAQAVDTSRTLLRFGNLVQHDPILFTEYLTGFALLETGLMRVVELAHDRDAPAMQLKRLARILGGLGPFDHGLVRAMKVDCEECVEIVNQIQRREKTFMQALDMDGGWMEDQLLTRLCFQPNKTKEMFAQVCREVIRNAPRAYGNMKPSEVMEAASRRCRSKRGALGPNAVGDILVGLWGRLYIHSLEVKCRIEADVAGMLLVCACNAYRRDHGTFPERLDDLVPDYIKAVARDPFDGEPFRYNRAKQIVYSVGEDLEDLGGSTLNPWGEEVGSFGSARWRDAEDAVFGLTKSAEAEESRDTESEEAQEAKRDAGQDTQ